MQRIPLEVTLIVKRSLFHHNQQTTFNHESDRNLMCQINLNCSGQFDVESRNGAISGSVNAHTAGATITTGRSAALLLTTF